MHMYRNSTYTRESETPYTSEVQRQKGKVRCVGHTEPKNKVPRLGLWSGEGQFAGQCEEQMFSN